MMPCRTSAPQQHVLTAAADRVTASLRAAAGGGLNSTWTWATVVAIVVFVVGTAFTVRGIRADKKRRKLDAEAEALQPFYVLLVEILVLLDKMADTAVTVADFKELDSKCSTLKTPERRWPEIPFGAVIAQARAYASTVLPDDYLKSVARKGAVDELLQLSRGQGAAVVTLRSAIEAVQREIERRASR